MDILHTDDGKNGRFYIEQDGNTIAEMTYVMTGPLMIIIDHTEVSPSLKGQGVGARLVLASVSHAREKQWKVMPLCPFAKREFERHQEFADVLAG